MIRSECSHSKSKFAIPPRVIKPGLKRILFQNVTPRSFHAGYQIKTPEKGGRFLKTEGIPGDYWEVLEQVASAQKPGKRLRDCIIKEDI